MKINWNQDPLCTSVEVDANDRERILLYIQNDAYQNILCSLQLRLDGLIKKDTPVTMEEIYKKVEGWGEICNMKADDEEVELYVSELQNAMHMGDCVRQPCSCIKCDAEVALGINTLEGLGASSAHKILMAYSGDRDMHQAIEYLKAPYRYEDRHQCWKDTDEETYMKHTVSWEIEKKRALTWLLDYKERHGF